MTLGHAVTYNLLVIAALCKLFGLIQGMVVYAGSIAAGVLVNVLIPEKKSNEPEPGRSVGI